VTDRAELLRELEITWHRDIPLAAAMGICVQSYDGAVLAARAPLPPNRNVHGTAFAGSLFSLCVLTGWGTTWLKLRERGLTGTIVVAESRIQYRKAVTGDLVCRCAPDASALESGLAVFQSAGRLRIDLDCTIDVGDKRAVSFTGTYVVHAAKH
jgi:thioesterase domain-containing protein